MGEAGVRFWGRAGAMRKWVGFEDAKSPHGFGSGTRLGPICLKMRKGQVSLFRLGWGPAVLPGPAAG